MRERFQRWWLPSALGAAIVLLVTLAIVSAVRVPELPKSASSQPPALGLMNGGRGDAESRELQDLEPLFLPTRFNSSVIQLPDHLRREPGSMSFTVPPFFAIGETAGGLSLPEVLPVPKDPAAVLTLGEPPNPLAELHRADVELPTVPQRLAHIEVRSAGTGEMVFSESIPSPANPVLPARDWAPLELMLAVDTAGLVGAPAVVRPTTSEDVQEFFRRFVARQLHLGARLSPGFYTVHIGP
jgi:hypothetical protein